MTIKIPLFPLQMQPGLSVPDGVSFSWTSPMEALISKSTISSSGFLVSLPVCPANLPDKCKASLVWPQLGLPGYPQRLLSLGLSLQFRSPRLTLGFGSRYQLIFCCCAAPVFDRLNLRLDLLRHFDKLSTCFNT